ncbi:transposase [Streptomyces sp. SID4946]|uniref:transposase n=1 Tax=Streptomyces sp. LamerLS-31b TaxID=1839765 RepID=UPI000B88132C|nr:MULTISPECIES: transposase [unclassified Streptomyces]MYQ90223.1 transposase [Streptomyces sp. SID4946]
MPAHRKYPQEVVERGVQLVLEIKEQSPERTGVVQEVGELLGIHPEALRHWVRKAQAEGRGNTATRITDAELIRLLQKEIMELRRKNTVLKAAAAIFASDLNAINHP